MSIAGRYSLPMCPRIALHDFRPSLAPPDALAIAARAATHVGSSAGLGPTLTRAFCALKSSIPAASPFRASSIVGAAACNWHIA